MSTWDAITGDRLWQDQVESTTPFDFSSIQGSLCLVAAGTQIRVRDALDRSWNGALLAHEKHVLTCSFGPDGQLVLSSSVDGLVRLWSRQTGKQLVATPKLSSLAQVMTFSPDGTKFVTAGDDGSVRIWRTADAEPTTGILSHGSNVTGVVFSPDGRYLVTTSGDARSPYQGGEPIIRFWDASNGEPYLLPSHQTTFRAAPTAYRWSRGSLASRSCLLCSRRSHPAESHGRGHLS